MACPHLFSLIFLGLVIVNIQASPLVEFRRSPISLPIAAHINATGGTAALIRADRARFAKMRARGSPGTTRGHASANPRAVLPISATDRLVTYTCDIPIGNPATSYTLLVDTGSSNTWVGAQKPYVVTNTSSETSDLVQVQYGSGLFSGKEYTDTVQIGSAAIQKQSIGVASFTSGISGVDGILGIGPVDLTQGTLSPDSNSFIPTVSDNLVSQGFISSELLGISFEPGTTTTTVTNGQLDFGGTDLSKYTGSISYVPITATEITSHYWGITQGLKYGASTTLLELSSAGIVDTGTTLLYLPSDAYRAYAAATGAISDANTGLLRITSEQFTNLQSLFFTIGAVTYEFTANAQIWPRNLNTFIGGSADALYLAVADSGANSGSGLDFINGYVWLKRFYTVYDTDNRRIGFATTPNTNALTN